uniref:Testis ecdysiotropin peptide E n=1 Tax=Lymantria dispar TaxID=13123 RepID=ECDE_LYMDI|nr:RecName: Full=Testis ecdysiotropin peptide E; Short=TE [Lymantria dispar]
SAIDPNPDTPDSE